MFLLVSSELQRASGEVRVGSALMAFREAGAASCASEATRNAAERVRAQQASEVLRRRFAVLTLTPRSHLLLAREEFGIAAECLPGAGMSMA